MERLLIHTPEGVRDIYGTELAWKRQTGRRLQGTFDAYGYREIQTPAFEFFDVFSKEVGTTPSKDLYKFFDKEGNTLALRPDFTPSIARCAAKYFMEDAMPIRLCYEGNAFTNTTQLQGKLNETTQMGAELIGEASVEADAEMICLVIEALRSCGFEKFTVSVGEIDFFKGICEETALDGEVVMELREYISVKNYYGAEEVLKEAGVAGHYLELLRHAGDICTFDELEEAMRHVTNERSMKALKRLVELYRLVEMYGLAEYLSFDLGMLSKFHYYTGIIFKAYTYGVGDAIVKGGRYDALLSRFGKDAPAVGCVFLLDDIQSALAAQGVERPEAEAITWIVYDENGRREALARIKELRAEGRRVSGIIRDPGISREAYVEYARRNQIDDIRFYGSV
ncbi:MAG: ATP phosphoribosyltransferase regulatory subunit [Lachnospiraceae bacterium]|nr:ATP phosphoribosyltransferase regulatory subunit [Lachnospiraceae bacterium]